MISSVEWSGDPSYSNLGHHRRLYEASFSEQSVEVKIVEPSFPVVSLSCHQSSINTRHKDRWKAPGKRLTIGIPDVPARAKLPRESSAARRRRSLNGGRVVVGGHCVNATHDFDIIANIECRERSQQSATCLMSSLTAPVSHSASSRRPARSLFMAAISKLCHRCSPARYCRRGMESA
jgi:hypothetical protein